MNAETKNEKTREEVAENNSEGEKKQTVRQRILSWLGFSAIVAAMLFFIAPESWWQFGMASVAERKPATNFTVQNIDGGDEWNFQAQKGKVVVINYWATWCPPCRAEMPGLVSFANEYKSRGVETVGVTMDENLEDVSPFVNKYRIEYPILLPGRDPNLSAGAAMSLPTTFLYDKNGRLAKKYTGIVIESTLKSDAEILLNE